MTIASATFDRPALDGGTSRPAGGKTTQARCPTVAQVMSRRPATVDAHTSLFSAWGRLHGQQGAHLVVLDEAARPVGLLDERDIALEWPPGPLGAHHLPVHRLLRFRARPRVLGSDSVASAARAMLAAHVDALPVVDEDGRLTGLISAQHCVELVAGVSPG
jgi:CBS domain-containing protein